MIESCRDICAYCARADGPFEDDHVVPRSRGGPDSPRNLVKACKACNRDKRDRLPSEWLANVPGAVAEIEARVCESVAVKIRGRRDWKPRHADGQKAMVHCFFCGGAIGKQTEGFVEFYYEEDGPPYQAQTGIRFLPHGGRKEHGELLDAQRASREMLSVFVASGRWRGWRPAAVFAHAECGPSNGYWIGFDQIARDDAGSPWCLESHVAKKEWASVAFVEAITVAREAIKTGFKS